MVHGQDRVEDVVRVGEAHAEQAVAGEQVAGVLDDGSLQGDFINHADIRHVLFLLIHTRKLLLQRKLNSAAAS